MKTIDFLPTRYSEKNAQRKAFAWRMTVTLLFSGVVAATIMFQVASRVEAKKQLAQIEPAYQQALSQFSRHGQLQTEYAESQHLAALYAYLKHPWPRSQILVQLSEPLPNSIVIGHIKLVQEAQVAERGTAPPPPIQEGEGQPTLPPAQLDLKKLRYENDSMLTTVHVEGVTESIVALHNYVAALGHSPLFQKIDLMGFNASERQTENNDAKESKDEKKELVKFNLRVVVKAGYGLPGGPQQPLLDVASPIEPESETKEEETKSDSFPVAANNDSNSISPGDRP